MNLAPFAAMAAKPIPTHPLLAPRMNLAVVIDDDPVCRMITKHALDQVGIRAFSAKDWVYGAWLVEYLRPGLVLVDGLLPQYDGARICSALRQRFPKGEVVLVLMTAFIHVFRDETNLKQSSAADLFIQKPFMPNSLIKQLRAEFPIPAISTPIVPKVNATEYQVTEAAISQFLKQFDRAARDFLARPWQKHSLDLFTGVPSDVRNPDEAEARRIVSEISTAMIEEKMKEEHVWHPNGRSSTISAGISSSRNS